MKTDTDVLEALKRKISDENGKDVYYYLFSRSGFSDELNKTAGSDKNVVLVGLNEIVSS